MDFCTIFPRAASLVAGISNNPVSGDPRPEFSPGVHWKEADESNKWVPLRGHSWKSGSLSKLRRSSYRVFFLFSDKYGPQWDVGLQAFLTEPFLCIWWSAMAGMKIIEENIRTTATAFVQAGNISPFSFDLFQFTQVHTNTTDSIIGEIYFQHTFQ